MYADKRWGIETVSDGTFTMKLAPGTPLTLLEPDFSFYTEFSIKIRPSSKWIKPPSTNTWETPLSMTTYTLPSPTLSAAAAAAAPSHALVLQLRWLSKNEHPVSTVEHSIRPRARVHVRLRGITGASSSQQGEGDTAEGRRGKVLEHLAKRVSEEARRYCHLSQAAFPTPFRGSILYGVGGHSRSRCNNLPLLAEGESYVFVNNKYIRADAKKRYTA